MNSITANNCYYNILYIIDNNLDQILINSGFSLTYI